MSFVLDVCLFVCVLFMLCYENLEKVRKPGKKICIPQKTLVILIHNVVQYNMVQHDIDNTTTIQGVQHVWCNMMQTIGPKHNDMIHYNAARYNTIRYHGIGFDTMQYDMIQYNLIRCDTMQYKEIQCYTMWHVIQCFRTQYNAIQYSMIPCNMVWFSTIQYNTTVSDVIHIYTIWYNVTQYNTVGAVWSYFPFRKHGFKLIQAAVIWTVITQLIKKKTFVSTWQRKLFCQL